MPEDSSQHSAKPRESVANHARADDGRRVRRRRRKRSSGSYGAKGWYPTAGRLPSSRTFIATATVAAALLGFPPAVSNVIVADINRDAARENRRIARDDRLAAREKAASDERVAQLQLRAARLGLKAARLNLKARRVNMNR